MLPVKRVRGNAKAFAEFVEEFRAGSSDGRPARRDRARRRARARGGAAGDGARERPAAQVELVTMLGPVVGTHAGPGTVGFFWFEDDR